jgi:hypothetical protein
VQTSALSDTPHRRAIGEQRLGQGLCLIRSGLAGVGCANHLPYHTSHRIPA